MVITSLDNEKIKKYRKLKKKKYREEYNEFIVEGMHLVLEAFKSGIIVELIMEETQAIPLPCPYVYVTREIITKISDVDTPSNIMALCKKLPERDLIGNKLLILDEVQDPGNLGTILRSAKAFDIDTVILSENTVDLYNPKVIRATQGMLFHLNVISRKINPILDVIKSKEIPIYGSSVDYGIDVCDLNKKDKQKYALIVGNEGNGIRSTTFEKCDKKLYIKMNERVESLNVAVATSILLYELNK
ncbi:MAG TPA: RNA methyltransferase [Candidatus Faecimonas gallistercoris]|nr:RNA methyltransferase [Candidatus Faecimonas gallistercoris]